MQTYCMSVDPWSHPFILATNIAETGITIPDITCVIDTGKYREMRFVLHKCPLINLSEIFVDLTRSGKSAALWKHLLPKAMLLRGADVLDEYKVDCAFTCSPKSVTTHR
jgi:hypothetical protein